MNTVTEETTFPLYDGEIPGKATEIPSITFYPSIRKTSKATVVIFPGGGYSCRAPHEGIGYAQFLNAFGMNAFVVSYRVAPSHFPDQLLDARRAVRFVRGNAEKFGIDGTKIAVMGSSAGGHLAAFVSTFRGILPGENKDPVDAVDYLPNAQILCYPVISADEKISHAGSYHNLLDGLYTERDKYSPDLIADEKTPMAFIWHTSEDSCVNVCNSFRYATRLREVNVPVEMHIFPYGQHGLGTAGEFSHVATWVPLLRNWLMLIGFLNT